MALFLGACNVFDEGAKDVRNKNIPAQDSIAVNTFFKRVDSSVSLGNYDTAQYYLDLIHQKLVYRKPSLFTYLLSSRQAEVYYYNNLLQLGLQEARRALQIAESLQDSLLLADAYNFCGLFYTNMKEDRRAIGCFLRGISYSSLPPYPVQYPEISNPHHLYGNIAEAYYNLHRDDSAVYYGRKSLHDAQLAAQPRGIASAWLGIGLAWLQAGNTDSAIAYLSKISNDTPENKLSDIRLNALSSLAKCEIIKGDRKSAMALLDEGFGLLQNNTNINAYYSLLFLKDAAWVYEYAADAVSLAQTLKMKAALQEESYEGGDRQYDAIMMMAMENEKRILNMEVAEARHERSLATTRLYLVVVLVLLLVAAFLAYRYRARQQLKLAALRNKISRDLHDEIGATLSGIALYSYLIKTQSEQNDTEQVNNSLAIIEKNATDMVKKLSDIVWSTNPVHDSLGSLLQRLEEYAREQAATKHIDVSFQTPELSLPLKLSMQQRQNIYLVAKEAVNNAVKYSNCSRLAIASTWASDLLTLSISDNGTGFDEAQTPKGNGLQNMKSRAREIKADFTIQSGEHTGTIITLTSHIT